MSSVASPFSVGVARCEISPARPELLKPTGMGRREPTFGVLDSLFAEALAVGLGEDRAILITSDLRFHPNARVKEVREAVGERLGIDPWRVLFSATHNHCSSPVATDRSPEAAAAEDEANLRIESGLIEACCEADANRRPAEMASACATLSAPIGQNRRMRFGSGLCINGWGAGTIVPPGQRIIGPAGPDSTRVDLWCARAPGAQQPFALFVSYATHPHLYELPAFSGEFPGAAKRILAGRIPGATVLQANHAGGDIDMHAIHPMPDAPEAQRAWFRESADRMGERLADAVMSAWPSLRYTTPGTFRHAVFTTEPRRTDPRQRSFNLVGVALDDAAFLSMPGELFHELGLRIHAGSPFTNLCLMAYNGTGGAYVPLPIGFEQGSYEVHHGPAPISSDGDALAPIDMGRGAQMETGVRLVEEALTVLRRLKPRV